MDEFIGELGSKLKVSITDSTMMCIVHDAMDRAHRKVKSRSVIARLSEMSRFYELAIIQLEGCLKFVYEEAEAYGFDSSHQDLLLDLAKIRNHLLRRLEESEMAISDKDREMMERAESERLLRQALELKERELESLRAQSEGFDEGKEGELKFDKLKNSVDQQVLNVRQNLEGIDHDEHYENGLGSESSSLGSDKRIERMGLDISSLKETLDLAFEKMQRAILSSDAGPSEQHLRWAIEKDVIASVIKGSIRDIQESLETGVASQQEKKENDDLYDELQKLNQENEELKLRERTVDELYVDLLRGLMDELHTSFLDFGTEVQIQEEILNSVLKGTLDLAFGKMQQSANFSSGAGPTERQWRLAIEKDITSHVIKGSIRDVRESLKSEVSGQEVKMQNVDLYNEVQNLKQENEELKLRERTSGELYVDLLRGLTDELCTGLFDSKSEVQIREGILNSTLKKKMIENKSASSKMLKECNNAAKNYKTESLISEEIHRFIYEETIRSIASAKNTELKGHTQIKAREVDDASRFGLKNDVFPLDLSVKSQNTPNPMRDELLMAPEELPSSMAQFLQEFSEVMSDFEHNVCTYLEKNNTRLESMKHQIDFLFGQTSLLKERESVYKKAFITRCQNLQKAETEVDLLGDQVDLLLGLLKIIYMKLCQHSTVFDQHFGVSEILMLIEKELGGRELRA